VTDSLDGILLAAQEGAEAEAERLARWLLLSSRHRALDALARTRPDAVDPSRRIAPDGWPATSEVARASAAATASSTR
jgi:hypothetical protein